MAKLEPGKMQRIARDERTDLEVWARYDGAAEVIELFASEAGDDYIGCCDSIEQAKAFAKDRFAEEIGNRRRP